MLDRSPKVFISYSWSNPDYESLILDIATRLAHDGVQVIFDKWDLKPGHDKYQFMEQSVTDPTVDRVLIFCDRIYAGKADHRQGGVGDETALITPKVYSQAKQEKFIPVIMERNDEGNPYVPAYLEKCMYEDLSNEETFEENYRHLVRLLYDIPEERRPELGNRPSWLEEKPSELSKVEVISSKLVSSRFIKTIEGSSTLIENTQDFIDTYVEAMKPFYKENVRDDEYLSDLAALQEYRDELLGYCKRLIGLNYEGIDPGILIGDILEALYNKLTCVHTFKPGASSCSSSSFDIFQVHLWEILICITTLLLKYERYADINSIITRTYFISDNCFGGDEKPRNYVAFCHYSEIIERRIKVSTSNPEYNNRITLSGHLLCEEHESLPIYSGKKMAEADLFLYQVFSALDLTVDPTGWQWFPISYIYAEKSDSMWKKLVSKRYCEKLYPLFGVKDIEELKSRVSNCVYDEKVRHSGGFARDAASTILTWVSVDDIGKYA